MSRSSKSRALIENARKNRFVGRLSEDGCLVNLAGNYDYLQLPYYVSEDYENEGKPIRPTCKDMIDAYVPPLFLEKARLAGVAVPEFYISNGYFEPPVIVDPINPFTLKGRVVLKPSRAKSIAKSLTRNYTYAVCCQELPHGSQIVYFKAILGWCAIGRFGQLARTIWDVFSIPVARVRAIRVADDKLLLSDIGLLPFADLALREIAYIQERVIWGN
ncbi:MAG TPA: hypothetical protein VMY05_02545 [Acidobacteriota bacterium]|nr:hypothetical protein [Armatimonadota bacterium]HUV29959.1 hypothetical protein [Acidobacteriota bacterium]